MRVLLVLTALFGFAGAQTELDAFFSQDDIAALERLVVIAGEASPAVLEAVTAVQIQEAELTVLGRLTDALTVTAGAGISGDIYSQVVPAYNINVSVNVMDLVNVDDRSSILDRRLTAIRSQSRLEVVQAFVAYVVARNAADASQLALASAEAAFQVASARLEMGMVTLSDSLAAQQAVGNAAVSLLRANGDLIVSLEALASVVGLPAEGVLEVVQATKTTGSRQ